MIWWQGGLVACRMYNRCFVFGMRSSAVVMCFGGFVAGLVLLAKLGVGMRIFAEVLWLVGFWSWEVIEVGPSVRGAAVKCACFGYRGLCRAGDGVMGRGCSRTLWGVCWNGGRVEGRQQEGARCFWVWEFGRACAWVCIGMHRRACFGEDWDTVGFSGAIRFRCYGLYFGRIE